MTAESKPEQPDLDIWSVQHTLPLGRGSSVTVCSKCMYVCMYVYAETHTHTHTHVSSRLPRRNLGVNACTSVEQFICHKSTSPQAAGAFSNMLNGC